MAALHLDVPESYMNLLGYLWFYKIYMGNATMCFPPEVRPLTRFNRALNYHP